MSNYDRFADTFARSRKGLYWGELELFFKSISPDESVLDIGCGSGRFLEQYKKYFGKLPDQYLGVDLSKQLIDIAQSDYPEQEFIQADMCKLTSTVDLKRYQNIFFIASFHHIKNYKEREKCIGHIYQNILKGSKILMTNWSLSGPVNEKKYKKCAISSSENKFGSLDYSIKIGDSMRFYHDFHIDELQELFESIGFHVCENRLFDTQKNIITIAEK